MMKVEPVGVTEITGEISRSAPKGKAFHTSDLCTIRANPDGVGCKPLVRLQLAHVLRSPSPAALSHRQGRAGRSRLAA